MIQHRAVYRRFGKGSHAVVHLKKGRISEVWISCHLNLMSKRWRRVFKFASPIPRIGCRRSIRPQTLPQLYTLCPSANNWHIWPSAPNSVESKTILRCNSPLQVAHSTCLCSIEFFRRKCLKKSPGSTCRMRRRAPCRKFWVSCQNIGDVFSSFDLPSLGLVANLWYFCRRCHNCTLCPSANNWRIWPQSQILWKVRRFCAAETVVLPQVAHSTWAAVKTRHEETFMRQTIMLD